MTTTKAAVKNVILACSGGLDTSVVVYRPDLCTFAADAVDDQRDAQGFIKLNALRVRSERARWGLRPTAPSGSLARHR